MKLAGKKVLVTGADGFIGSHLVEQLIREGSKVTAFVYYNSFNSWGWLDSLPQSTRDKIEIYMGDIRNADSVRQAVKGQQVVFHLAALIGIPYSYVTPESYLDTNAKGTLNVLMAAKDYGVEKVLCTSTSEVYGTAMKTPIREDHPRQGQSPYSATKIAADSMVDAFFRSFSLPVVTVRPFNTFGPRQSARAVIPSIITQLMSGKTELKMGAITPTRDMVYVKDTVKGFAEIAKSDKTVGEDINIATQREISIGELANMLVSKINPDAKIVTDEDRIRPEKSEVNRLLGSCEKLKRLTGWSPQTSFSAGLDETISWFGEEGILSKYKADIYNV